MSRAGTKKRPYYHIIVADSRSPRDGKFIERIGSYNPLLDNDNEQRVKIDADRAKHWLGVGAQMSDRVHLFFNRAGIVETKPAFKPARPSKKEQKKAESEAA